MPRYRAESARRTGWVLSAMNTAIAEGETANERAYISLKRAVLSGVFRPGEVLTLRALATRFSLGETAMREAVKRLISEGAFEGLPNRSARVPMLDRRKIQGILDLRMLLESNAAVLAAQHISLRQIEGLRTLHESMESSIATGDSDAYKQLNIAFHFEIYRIANNETLAALMETLWLRMAPFVARTLSLITDHPTGAWSHASRHHEALLSAFQNGDVEAARQAMQQDLLELFKLADHYFQDIALSSNTQAPRDRAHA